MVRRVALSPLLEIVLSVFASFHGAFAQDNDTPDGWQNESQVGIVRTTGNTDTESYRVRQTVIYNSGDNSIKLKGSFLNATSKLQTTGEERETAKKWESDLRYERRIDRRWSVLTGYLLESNKFAGYRQRHNSDIGLKYFLLRKPRFNIFLEAGYRYVHENSVDNSRDYNNTGRIYSEANYQLNFANKASLWGEYIPNLDNGDDYLINYEASVTSALTDSFSLKVAFLSNFDNSPAAKKKKEDTTLTTSLVATF